MLPMILKAKIPTGQNDFINVYLPLFIVWLIVIPIVLLFSPVILLAGFLSWSFGYGRLFILFFKAIVDVLWNLQGLMIEVQDKKNHIYLSFL